MSDVTTAPLFAGASDASTCEIISGGGRSNDASRSGGVRSAGVDAGASSATSASSSSDDTPCTVRPANGRVLWCVAYVRPGHELAMEQRIRRVAADALDDTAVLRREVARRRDGSWITEVSTMFPGYVMLASHDPDLLQAQLKLITAPVRLLRTGGAVSTLATLDAAEVELIHALGGAGRTVAMSRGAIVDGALAVEHGPLRGREDLIVRVDRHRRMAFLDPVAFGCLANPELAEAVERLAAEDGMRPGRGSVRPGRSAKRTHAPYVGLEVVAKS